jgi:hypothetical protein
MHQPCTGSNEKAELRSESTLILEEIFGAEGES